MPHAQKYLPTPMFSGLHTFSNTRGRQIYRLALPLYARETLPH